MPVKKVRDMGESKRVRKPRIRKTAPTIRERAEAAKTKAEQPKTSRLHPTLSKAASPLSRVRLPENKATSALKRVGRILAKILKWLVPNYFVNAWREVRLVAWPTRKETWRLTSAVFIFAIVFGAMVAAVDKGLDEIFKNLVLK
jgi:preprotein translocase SecE subunit